MSRERLPDRRASEVTTFEHDGLRYRGLISRFADGRIAEVFLDAGKVGTAAHVLAKDAAVILSIALQSGADAGVIRAAMSQERDGTMRGPIGRLLQLIDGDAP